MTTGRTIAIQGAGTNFYICNNTFERTGLPDDNAGEQIMLENLGYLYEGSADFIDADNFAIPFKGTLKAGYMVNVVSGKGQSQCREIKAVAEQDITLTDSDGVMPDEPTMIVTLTKPFDVMPDDTTILLITNCFRDVAISNNLIDGYANYLANPGASSGLQVYGSTYNLFFTDNTTKNFCQGMQISPHYLAENCKAIISWNMFDDITIENCAEGIRFVYVSDIQDAAESSYGNVFRRISIKNIDNYHRSGTLARNRRERDQAWSHGRRFQAMEVGQQRHQWSGIRSGAL